MRSRTTRAAVLLAIAAAAIIPASAMGNAHAARTRTVTLKDIRFHPGNLSINRGDSVTWAWHDGRTRHNVTGASFHSHTQSHGSFTVRFTHTGTFNYRCTIHASKGMKGKIVVH
ncbi:MAG TPA: plastocyanin/azurin family copper-binding protein [Solirubrobacteraceae bacterium]|nr:plastocyanin/azurin family copper-binding protein [Solirubrobacteraceae bacterium]